MNKSSRKKLKDILDSIEAGDPVAMHSFIELAEKAGIPRHTSNYQITNVNHVYGKDYTFTISKELREKLAPFADIAISKEAAALHGDTHEYKAKYSAITLLRSPDSFPEIVMIDDQGEYQLFDGSKVPTAKHLLIVENKDIFFRIGELKEFFNKDCPLSLDDVWVVLGDGNTITNTYHKQFLRAFPVINYFMDIDAGGIGICSRVINLVGRDSTNHKFILPFDVDKHLKMASTYLTSVEKDEIYLAAKNYPELQDVYNLLITNDSRSLRHEYVLNLLEGSTNDGTTA